MPLDPSLIGVAYRNRSCRPQSSRCSCRPIAAPA